MMFCLVRPASKAGAAGRAGRTAAPLGPATGARIRRLMRCVSGAASPRGGSPLRS